MRNADLWRESKFVQTPKGLRASRDPACLGRGSRFMGDLLAPIYEQALREHARGRLLDVGAGKVPLYGVYRDLVTENICLDWENTAHKNPHLDREYDLTRGIPYPDEAFDTVLASDVVEHIPNPEHLWREMARVLRPGGTLILGVPFFYWVHEAPHDYYRHTEHSLARLCHSNNLTVLSLEPYGGSAEVVLDIIAKHLAFSGLLSAVHYRLSGIFSRSVVGRWLRRRSAHLFPLGYCLIARKPGGIPT